MMLTTKIKSLPKKIATNLLVSFTPSKKTTLKINYYDSEGQLVGSHSLNPIKDGCIIDQHHLRILIDAHIPQNYAVFPNFAYPKEDITANNIPQEIMVAVKASN